VPDALGLELLFEIQCSLAALLSLRLLEFPGLLLELHVVGRLLLLFYELFGYRGAFIFDLGDGLVELEEVGQVLILGNCLLPGFVLAGGASGRNAGRP